MPGGTEIFDRAGQPINELPAEMLMGVDDRVDIALAGLDTKEAVTHFSAGGSADVARLRSGAWRDSPYLSQDRAAAHYRQN